MTKLSSRADSSRGTQSALWGFCEGLRSQFDTVLVDFFSRQTDLRTLQGLLIRFSFGQIVTGDTGLNQSPSLLPSPFHFLFNHQMNFDLEPLVAPLPPLILRFSEKWTIVRGSVTTQGQQQASLIVTALLLDISTVPPPVRDAAEPLTPRTFCCYSLGCCFLFTDTFFSLSLISSVLVSPTFSGHTFLRLLFECVWLK